LNPLAPPPDPAANLPRRADLQGSASAGMSIRRADNIGQLHRLRRSRALPTCAGARRYKRLKDH
jgi:hypothetical protein